MALAMVVVSID